MNYPLVTITIPTYNSEKHLHLCLAAVAKQTYANVEVNIIDGMSKDKTIEVAKKNGVTDIRSCNGGLLQARYDGIRDAKGKYALLLDSDQILENDAVERCVAMSESHDVDMLILEEDVYRCDNVIEKLFHYDRKLIHNVKDLDPFTSVLLPRFFKLDLLKSAFDNMPQQLIPKVGGPDHAMIYFESWKISQNVEIVPNSVRHIEPNSLIVMLPKFFRWGYTSVDAHCESKYDELLQRKECFRKGLFTNGLIKESVASIILLIIKGVPFKLGYYSAKMNKFFSKFKECENQEK